ncbi:MAG: sigma-70 family RNA polymerase sigma factor [Faecalicoccus sp.]|jgi:RNA polymerase sigma factor (sigma-70 family)|uniref:RNA polymerase sigma factor n=1 Tax=Faecalicoccus sp. TaxID=1971758 RepID=UPI002A82C9CE|nr:sigma-70 family RNA polymerase sigma factor [Faecalicoccus sp.]MDY4279316.1 sigma-70 family RNA polymerase sigma factor [Faecalicoccus sp.]
MDDNKRKLWVNGQFIEVSEEVYQVYMQGDRKMRYFETDLKTERTMLAEDGTVQRIIPSREDSLDRLMDDNARQFSDASESVEDAVLRKMAEDELHRALEKLTDEEYALVYALFFEGKTERAYAKELGVAQVTVHKKKQRILKMLKEILK